MSNTISLGELGERLHSSGHRDHDGEDPPKQDEGCGSDEGHGEEEQEAGTNEGWGATTEEERRAAVGRGELLGVQTSTKWAEMPLGGWCFDCRTWGEWEWTGFGKAKYVYGLRLAACRVGDFPQCGVSDIYGENNKWTT
jgi:hypothetical protein